MNRLLNKVVAITGATKGIGRGIALDLAAEGALVTIGGRDEHDGLSLVNEIWERFSRKAIFIPGDIKSEDYCKRFIQDTISNFGKLDGLVNNAGIFPEVSFFECDAELFDEVYAINVRGAFLCSKYAAKAMSETGGGSIVHIGSTHAFGASPHYSLYGTSKGALYSLSSFLAQNLASMKIRSNWITVGWVATPGEIERVQMDGHDLDWLNKISGKLIPLGSLQSTKDISYGVIYLLSDEAAQVTNTDIKITGGFVPAH